MRFTLFYDGELPPNGNAAAKHKIREALHPQIKELWQHQGLVNIDYVLASLEDHPGPNDRRAESWGKHVGSVNGVRFASVVHPTFYLRARLKILLLRASPPGGVLTDGGDIDNRLKTLFDALSRPSSQQLPPGWAPAPDQIPLHCLLDDDRLVTAVAVDSDRLLGPALPNWARVTIQVHLHAAQSAHAHALFLTP